MDPHTNVMGLLGLFWDYDGIILPLAVLLNVMVFARETLRNRIILVYSFEYHLDLSQLL